MNMICCKGSYLLVSVMSRLPTSYPSRLLIGCCWCSFYKRHFLDVFHLGKDQATNLWIETERFQFSILCCVSLLTGTATALVGPITFLGFIVANVSYRLFATYRHGVLLLGSF